MTESEHIEAARIAASYYNGFLPSEALDPAWIAGWHAAINQVVHVLAKGGDVSTTPGVTNGE